MGDRINGRKVIETAARGVTVEASALVNTGQFQAGHEHEGKWAVQILIAPFDSEQLAADVGDRVKSMVHRVVLLKGDALVGQVHPRRQ